ncbi:hypothetical protein [Marinobacterium rhizophilum]|uniref:transglycosylase SLT domain-containing protein n=1 Tax=Marinobacterium rhizophilum TaxID=420402 RepID=UPI003B84A780
MTYHEGWGGHRNGSCNGKRWLTGGAGKVDQRSSRYANHIPRIQSVQGHPQHRQRVLVTTAATTASAG